MRGDINFCKTKINEFLELEEEKIKKLGLKNPIDYFKIFKFSDLINKEDYQNDKYKGFATQSHEDAMPLAKFIYFVLWSEDVPDNKYSLKDLKDNAYNINYYGKTYGSETINTYASLFGEFSKEETEYKAKNLPKIKDLKFNTNSQLCKIDIFLDKCFTIGNFMLLPKDIKFDNQTLNQIKGMSKKYSDFADLFYCDLFNSKLYEKLQITANDFCKNNFLEDYFNIEGEKYIPKKVFLHDKYRQERLTEEFILDYATKAAKIIESRSDKICMILEENMKKI